MGKYKWGYRGCFKSSRGLGFRVVISGDISGVTIIIITHIGGLITLLTTAHEPPSWV